MCKFLHAVWRRGIILFLLGLSFYSVAFAAEKPGEKVAFPSKQKTPEKAPISFNRAAIVIGLDFGTMQLRNLRYTQKGTEFDPSKTLESENAATLTTLHGALRLGYQSPISERWALAVGVLVAPDLGSTQAAYPTDSFGGLTDFSYGSSLVADYFSWGSLGAFLELQWVLKRLIPHVQFSIEQNYLHRTLRAKTDRGAPNIRQKAHEGEETFPLINYTVGLGLGYALRSNLVADVTGALKLYVHDPNGIKPSPSGMVLSIGVRYYF